MGNGWYAVYEAQYIHSISIRIVLKGPPNELVSELCHGCNILLISVA